MKVIILPVLIIIIASAVGYVWLGWKGLIASMITGTLSVVAAFAGLYWDILSERLG